mmetsp:Transcript_18055/g.56024  ORF Transcript_18055/g.56024 Transcript_18055/m.56024 type:complete len:323 (-) Transcript_18055:519-1487(-)
MPSRYMLGAEASCSSRRWSPSSSSSSFSRSTQSAMPAPAASRRLIVGKSNLNMPLMRSPESMSRPSSRIAEKPCEKARLAALMSTPKGQKRFPGARNCLQWGQLHSGLLYVHAISHCSLPICMKKLGVSNFSWISMLRPSSFSAANARMPSKSPPRPLRYTAAPMSRYAYAPSLIAPVVSHEPSSGKTSRSSTAGYLAFLRKCIRRSLSPPILASTPTPKVMEDSNEGPRHTAVMHSWVCSATDTDSAKSADALSWISGNVISPTTGRPPLTLMSTTSSSKWRPSSGSCSTFLPSTASTAMRAWSMALVMPKSKPRPMASGP